MGKALAVVVGLVEHHYIAVLALAHSHVPVRISHTLIKRVTSWSVTSSCGPTSTRRFVKMLVVCHV